MRFPEDLDSHFNHKRWDSPSPQGSGVVHGWELSKEASATHLIPSKGKVKMADQKEKSHSTHSMEVENAQPHQGDKSNEVEEIFTPEQQTAILRKVDRRLIGATGVMYCISLMDRNNLGAAALAGMNRDLNLIAYRYVSSVGCTCT